MESEGVPGRVNISEDTRRMIESDGVELPFSLEFNKIVKVKGVEREYKSYLCNFDIWWGIIKKINFNFFGIFIFVEVYLCDLHRSSLLALL